jgi:hypothetical protein
MISMGNNNPFDQEGVIIDLRKRLFSKRLLLLKQKLIQVDWSGSARLLREQRDRGDPTGVSTEEAHRPPRGKRASGAEINHTALLDK